MNKLALSLFGEGSSGFQGIGPLGLEGKTASDSPTVFNSLITTIIGTMTVVAIIWFAIQLFTGASAIIGSGGDQQKLESARKKIFNGLIGIVVVIAAIFILDLVGQVIGIDKFLQPDLFIRNVWGNN